MSERQSTTAERSRRDGRAERWSPTRIGELVALYRNLRGLRVSEIARLVGVTPSLISQIERGNSRPSVATLFALAEALDVPVDVFADRDSGGEWQLTDGQVLPSSPSAAERYVVRREDRRSIEIDGGVRWELLSPEPSADVEFLELVYAPHAQSNPTQYRHPGREMLLVLQGSFEIHVGFEVIRLEEGDSMAFPATRPHRYVNPTGQIARALTIILSDTGPRSLLTRARREEGRE
jgi:transcriptional regulator with XRE-family HTH domain